MKPVELTLSVEINASQQEVFNKVVDWESQGEWMLGTKVKGTKNNGQGLGGEINAWTGFWKIGFNDPMVITQWVEPKVVDVKHLGKIVKGTGSMIVEKIDENVFENFKLLGVKVQNKEIWNPTLSELIEYWKGFENTVLDVDSKPTG